MEMIGISRISSSLHVVNNCETSRHDKIINKPILERKKTILNVTNKTKNSLRPKTRAQSPMKFNF